MQAELPGCHLIGVSASGSGTTPTDLALLGFLGTDIAHFGLVSATPNGETGATFVYNLVTLTGTGGPLSNGQAAIPEPASLCLVGTGLLMAYRRRQANKANKA